MLKEVTKVALYSRVSTEEQALHGYSIEKQIHDLKEYAKNHNYIIVDIYTDEGISARKNFNKRKEFIRLLEDVRQKKFELILFTKLDRWFRNISDYYKVQDILEKYNVNWKTIYENYDTSTSSGRLHINIMLSVAQDEADKTSERIKKVFESKIEKGEAITGIQPFGYKIVDKKVVIDEEKADIVRDLFNYYEASRSIHATYKYYMQTYHDKCSYSKIASIFRKEIYIGKYKDNSNYCEAIITKEQFERVQALPHSSFVRENSTNRIYIFSSLVTCKECNHKMNGMLQRTTKSEYYAYRCRRAASYHLCTHRKSIREDIIESYLIDNLETLVKEYVINVELAEKQKKAKQNSIDKSAIKRKLSKLKELYVNDLINLEEYKVDYAKYQELLKEADTEQKQRDLSALKEFINSDYQQLYADLTRKEKQIFWREVVSEIVIDEENCISIFF